MTKAELVDAISKDAGITQAAVGKVIKSFATSVIGVLEKGGKKGMKSPDRQGIKIKASVATSSRQRRA